MRDGNIGVLSVCDDGIVGIVIDDTTVLVRQVNGVGGDEQFVDFAVDGQFVIAVEVHLVTDTQFEVGGQEVTTQRSGRVGHLVTHVGDAQAGTQSAVVQSFGVEILFVKQGEVGGAGQTGFRLLAVHELTGGEVGVDEARGDGDGQLVDQFAGIGEVDSELIGILAADELTVLVHEIDAS